MPAGNCVVGIGEARGGGHWYGGVGACILAHMGVEEQALVLPTL